MRQVVLDPVQFEVHARGVFIAQLRQVAQTGLANALTMEEPRYRRWMAQRVPQFRTSIRKWIARDGQMADIAQPQAIVFQQPKDRALRKSGAVLIPRA